jgi:hypothetical protein
MNIARHHKQALVRAGFQDVVDEVRKVSLAVLCMILLRLTICTTDFKIHNKNKYIVELLHWQVTSPPHAMRLGCVRLKITLSLQPNVLIPILRHIILCEGISTMRHYPHQSAGLCISSN